MGWDGNGVVTLTQDFTTDLASGLPDSRISASKMDDVLEDLATSIESTLNRNGENAIAANINFGGYRITNMGAAASANDACRARQIAENTLQYGGTTGGTGDAFSVTSSYVVAVAAGLRLLCLANRSNTGASTLSVNGATGIAIKKKFDHSTALSADDIVSGKQFEVFYDGTFFILINGPGLTDVVTTDIGVTVQGYGVALEAIKPLTPAADRVPYYTSASAAALATFTAFGRSLIDDADATAGRDTLGIPFSVIKNYAFAAGVKSIFYQAAAPTGWTLDSSKDDYGIRINTGTGGATSGSTAYTSVLGARTIAQANLPNATLTVTGSVSSTTTLTNASVVPIGDGGGTDPGGGGVRGSTTAAITASTTSTFSSGASSSINGGVTQTTMNFSVRTLDCVLCTKD
jgi:hypothetical protein